MKAIYAINAPKRSGHHAFINTLLLRNKSPLLFINNPKPDKQFYFRKQISRKPSYRLQFNQSARDLFETSEEVEGLKEIFFSPEPPKRNKLKSLLRNNNEISLIVNFEEGYAHQHLIDKYLRKTKRFTCCTDIKLIRFCRDPLNLIASKLLWTNFYRQQDGLVVPTHATSESDSIVNMIIQRCRADLQFSNKSNDNEITIDYASWLDDASYASQKAAMLGLTLHPPMAQTTIHGGGSSWEEGTKSGPAYLQRFTPLTGTEPFDTIVSTLETDISRYYNQLNLAIFTSRHPAMGSHADSSDLGG